ncbi:MAG: NrfD/PsrC family molybdoenzyme membrane anchor subunit [Dehalococcoidia bacterium]
MALGRDSDGSENVEALRPVTSFRDQLEERSLAPLQHTGQGFYLLVGFLLAVIAWGVFTYSYQLRDGLIVTGMRDRMSWGLYIAMFVFFIGASMAGTFVSAVLRITKAGWRTPVTRTAELVTVAALLIAGLFITFDLGRPDRIYHTALFGRWESPLIWDIYGLTTYLTGSVIYLYAALVPDLAYCRDRLNPEASPIKRWFYRVFSIGWVGNPTQRRRLQTVLTVMMIAIIPVAVMMHTVTSWIFAMTLREPWDSPMFGIYFVGGAIFSGSGIIIILMAALRKAYRLENFITQKHFLYLGYLMAALAAIMLFFNLSEIVTHAYKLRGHIEHHLVETFIGSLAPLFWTYLLGGIVLPILIIANPLTRNIKGIVVAAVLVNIGMVIERYLIVGGLHVPLNPYPHPSYSPTWVEWSLMAAGIAAFILLITLLLKLVPSVAVTEMLEERGEPVPESPTAEPAPRLWREMESTRGGGS